MGKPDLLTAVDGIYAFVLPHFKPLSMTSENKAGPDADDSSITLDPDAVEDLEEELLEIGFSPEAAAWIVGKVPE
jgi:hypothetical protein